MSQLRLKWNTQQRLGGTPKHVSVVRPHGILMERRDDVLRGRNNEVSSVRLHDVSSKS